MSSSWLSLELDTMDMTIFVALTIGALYYLYTQYVRAPSENDYRSFSGVVPVQTTVSNGDAGADVGFIQKMKNSERSVAIFYGSQTGTGEELAGRLAKDAKRYGLKAIVLDPEECEMEDLSRLTEIEQSVAIFCMATYGEGDPTDNAQQFHDFLKAGNADMTGLRYAVFALGNKTYEHFNEMGVVTDNKLEEMGGTRMCPIGMGDDDGSLEEDFMKWREHFWPIVCETFSLVASGEDINMRNYRLELVDAAKVKQEHLFVGEMARLGSYKKQRPPFDQKNPFLAPVVVNRELHAEKSTRSCKHIEFDLTGSRLRYEAGDHAGIYPTNDIDMVNKLQSLLSVDLGQVFKLINLDEDSSKKHPFPCPTTYGTALTHYVDITQPVKSHVLRELAAHCSEEESKATLLAMSTSNEESMKEYNRYVLHARRSIVDILSEHPSCQPPIDLLLEMLPRLQPRYYSISSSPRDNSLRVSVTSVVVDYSIEGRHIKGVCTNFLKDKPISSTDDDSSTKITIPLFIRKSTLRLPHRANVPAIMIGPGTGFAPFRGFLQDRDVQRKEGKEVGSMVLYFGCRRRDEDYIYSSEIADWQSNGTLTHAHIAFSREQEEKCYVQHLLWKEGEAMWKLVDQQGAHVYVCGDARNMARDVMDTFHRIAREHGGKTEQEAIDYMKKMEQTKRYQADVWS